VEVHRHLVADWPELTTQDILDAVKALDANELLADADDDVPAAEFERYQSNLAFLSTFASVDISGAFLALRVANGNWAILSPFADRLLAALVLRQFLSLVFQFLICLRTDGYLLVTSLLGCRDLLETTKLHLCSVLLRLTPAQQAKLADSPARDRQVASSSCTSCGCGCC
jgi:hypothetical protein